MADHPECQNCDFYRLRAEGGQHCAKHQFVMPSADWQTICRDWQHDNQPIDFEGMEPGMLYYYSWGSGDILIAPMGHFSQLQHPLISVSIRKDKQLGWVIYPRKQTIFFPEPDEMVTVYVGDRKSKFQVVNTERTLAKEMIPCEDGGWETQYHTQRVFMLHSLESPDLLYNWTQSFMDFDAYITDSFSPSLFAFIEVIHQGREYILHPDLLTYEKYIRR